MGQIISSGGEWTVSSGQIDGGDIVSSGGFEYVLSGGEAINTSVYGNGAMQVLGGKTEDAFLTGGAFEYLYSGGVSIGTTITTSSLESAGSGTTAHWPGQDVAGCWRRRWAVFRGKKVRQPIWVFRYPPGSPGMSHLA